MTLSGLVRILQQAGHVAHEDQAPGFERNRRLRRGHVSVAVVDLAILAARGRADDGVMPFSMHSSSGATFTPMTSPT